MEKEGIYLKHTYCRCKYNILMAADRRNVVNEDFNRFPLCPADSAIPV